MAEAETNQLPTEENFDYEEEESLVSMILKNGFKILLGLIVLVVLAVGIFFAIQFLTKQTKKTPAKTATSSPAKPVQNEAFPQVTGQTQTTASYKDSTYNYSISLPSGWEAFKRTGENGSYQTGFRPSGSTDVPFVVNIQPNTQNLDLKSIVTTRFGNTKTYEEKTIGGQKALLVSVPEAGYNSYFIIKNKVIYELSFATGDNTYLPFANSFVSSFRFTR